MSRRTTVASPEFELPMTRFWFTDICACKDGIERGAAAQVLVDAVGVYSALLAFLH